MNDEQKAIVKAKAQGDLAITAVTSAMRSCFPGYKAFSKGRKPLSAMIVDPDGDQETNEDLDQFEDVEAFLTDHPGIGAHHQDEDIPEEEAAEALAVSWRERRREITPKRGLKSTLPPMCSVLATGPPRSLRLQFGCQCPLPKRLDSSMRQS